MAFQLADRVRETSTSTGTGNFTLTGPVTGYSSFNASITSGNTLYYTIADQSGANWEVGIGTFTATATLARTTVISNSLGTTALISFTAGTKDVFIDLPSEAAVTQTDVGTLPNQVPLNQMLGKLAFQDVLDTVTNNPYIDTSISAVQPTLNLDFVNAKTLDPRITFTRSTTATYYDGKTSAIAEQNLLLQSQTFGTGWTLAFATLPSSNNTAPDGTATATLYQLSTSATPVTNQISQQQQWWNTATTYTVSCYVKAGTSNYVTICNRFGSGNYGVAATFDLTAPTAATKTFAAGGASGTIIGTPTITAVTGATGWYRISISYTAGYSSVQVACLQINSTNNPTYGSNGGLEQLTVQVGTESIYIWGFQVEAHSGVGAYVPTTTLNQTYYVPKLLSAPANTPRFDYEPVSGTPKGLLLEIASTNLARYSQDFTNSAWAGAGSGNFTVSGNTNIAPDGTLTAGLLIPTTTTGQHAVSQSISGLSQPYTFSLYAKAGGYTRVGIREAVGNSNIVFDLTSGIIVGTNGADISGSITSVGNGWYRCIATSTRVQSATFFAVPVLNTTETNCNTSSYAGNGTSGVYVWGAQLENLAFPTSYIPTTTATVQRVADSASISYGSWFNQGQGSWYMQTSGTYNSAGGGSPILGTQNSVTWICNGDSASRLGMYYVQYNNLTYLTLPGGVAVTNPWKTTMAYGFGTATLAINGGASVVGTWNPALDQAYSLTIFPNTVTSGWVAKLAYYPVKLSTPELLEMTQ